MPPVIQHRLRYFQQIALLSIAAFQHMKTLDFSHLTSKRFYITSKSLKTLSKFVAKNLLLARQDDAYMCHFRLITASFD